MKAANILLNSRGQVKLGDFGLSRVLGSKHNFAQTFLGTPFYMSPVRLLRAGLGRGLGRGLGPG